MVYYTHFHKSLKNSIRKTRCIIISYLPSSYKYSIEYLYYIDGEGKNCPLCNFIPHVISATKPKGSNSLDDIVVEFQLIIEASTEATIIKMNLSKIKTLDWESIHYRCKLNAELKVSIICKHLFHIIRHQLSSNDLVKEVPIYEHTGWVMFNDVKAYLAGNKLITLSGIASPTTYQFPNELNKLNLEVDDTLDIKDTAKYMKNLLDLSPGVSDILVANLLSGLLRSLFVEASIPPKFTCYLVGQPQSKKTSIACHINSIYNRSENSEYALINLLSSSSAVHNSINLWHDSCFIVDDLYESANGHEMTTREERLGQVIRTVGNNSAKVTMRGKEPYNAPPNCNVVCTAEYLIPGYSTLSRCVVIHINNPISNELLFESQKNPKALSTFVYHFIRWCCGKYNELISLISSQYNTYLEKRSHRIVLNERQYEARFILNTSIKILLQYFIDNQIFNDISIRAMQIKFRRSYKELLLHQEEDMKQNERSNGENRFSKFIAYLYENNMIELEKKKKNLDNDSLGIIYKDNLCLSSTYILSSSRDYFKDGSITINKIITELKQNCLLDLDKSNKSTKKVNGIRLLHIPLNKLESYIDDNNSELADPTLTLKCKSLSWH